MDLFDDLAQSLARGISRRQAIKRFAGGVTAAVVGSMIPWRSPAIATAAQRFRLYASGVDMSGMCVPGMLPFVQMGDNGPKVKAIQYLLREHGISADENDNGSNDNDSGGIRVDGFFGGQTDGAVRSFQGMNGLTVDGIVGSETWGALFVTVQQGDKGPAVKAVEALLNAHGIDLKEDGDFGDDTDREVRSFQSMNCLVEDGIVGTQTWTALVTI
jgi:peptidoglycan hydrolase-like protein with peptidoglycan-binding domain